MRTIKETRKRLRDMFREYWNDYLTIGAYAQAQGISREEMYKIINLGRILHNKRADQLKRMVQS